jgi:hypothetical protein
MTILLHRTVNIGSPAGPPSWPELEAGARGGYGNDGDRYQAANAVVERRSPWLRLKEVVVENMDRDRNQSTHSERRVERDGAQPLAESLSARHVLSCDAHRAGALHQARHGSMRTSRLRLGDSQHEVVIPSPAYA